MLLEEARRIVRTHDLGIQIKETVAHGILCPMSFRGSFDNFTCRFLKRLGVPRRFLTLIIVRTLVNTYKMFQAYTWMTSAARLGFATRLTENPLGGEPSAPIRCCSCCGLGRVLPFGTRGLKKVETCFQIGGQKI